MKNTILTLATLYLFLPCLALADTIISSPINADTTWTVSNSPYIIDSNFRVESGITLTLEPGTTVKARVTGMGGPSIYGRLVAQGTASLPIKFTSFADDGVVGQWQGLNFQSGSEGIFDHAEIAYAGMGGYGYGNFVGITNFGGSVDIRNSNIHDNYSNLFDWSIGNYKSGFGIYNKNGSLTVAGSNISSNNFAISSESGTTTILSNTIQNNFERGVDIRGPEALTLTNNIFAGNGKTAYVEMGKLFIHTGNTSSDFKNKGFEMTGIAVGDTTLDSNDLPIIVSGGITVPLGATLHIAPGTIIKFGTHPSFGSLSVQGKLEASGTRAKPIYFTSLRDDAVGGDNNGDTNGDGALTLPAKRDWNALFFEAGSEVNMDYTTVRYSGYNYNGEYLPGVAGAIYERGGQFSLKNSVLEQNYGASIFQDAGSVDISGTRVNDNILGLQFRGGDMKISNSSFSANTSNAIYSQSGPIVDARNNWWGSPTGPKDLSTTTPTGTGESIAGDILYIPFLTSDPSNPTTPVSQINPVIIIPGIMGSAYKNGQLVLDPILHTFDDLVDTLVANGYEQGKTLFTFPYEWRDSNVLSANLLKAKIDQVKSACVNSHLLNVNCSQVDLVAHSMGGLVAREYVQSGQYTPRHDVDQLIFLGTPHKGSPKSYLQWEAGQFTDDIGSTLSGLFFEAEALKNGYPTVFSYIHNRPISSVQELLPTSDYLKDKSTGNIRTYPTNYPRNLFLEYLNNNTSSLLNSGVKITNIVGDSKENKTIEKVRVVPTTHPGLWSDGEPDGFYIIPGDNGLEKGVGDNTVTTLGATLDNSIPNQVIISQHRRLPTLAEAKVFNILTGKNATTTFDTGSNIDPKVLILQLFSPVDFVITAPDGKRVGKNFSNNQEFNEVPGAFYSGFNNNDSEYITILNPLDGDYKVELQGTGSGEYTVATSLVSDVQATTTKTVGVTTPGQITDMSVQVNNDSVTKVEKKVNLDILITDINGAYNLGWIKDKKTRDDLLRKVQGLYNGKTFDKKSARLLITSLNDYTKAKISVEAYNLIKSDLEYIIAH